MIHRGKHGDITWSYCRAPETKGSLQRTRRKCHGLTICGYNNAIHANTILGPSHWHLRRSVGPESYYLTTQYRMEQETGTYLSRQGCEPCVPNRNPAEMQELQAHGTH